MHKQLVKHASEEQLKEFVQDVLSMLKETHHDLYEELEDHLYKMIYGCHFNEWMLYHATKNMVNEDGTKGPHWTIEETNKVARSNGVMFSSFNEYDWNYVMNMVYSDYYGSIPNDPVAYAKVAKKFIEDKDAPEGKALRYYSAMKS